MKTRPWGRSNSDESIFAKAVKVVVNTATFVKIVAFSLSSTIKWIKDLGLPFLD